VASIEELPKEGEATRSEPVPAPATTETVLLTFSRVKKKVLTKGHASKFPS